MRLNGLSWKVKPTVDKDTKIVNYKIRIGRSGFWLTG